MANKQKQSSGKDTGMQRMTGKGGQTAATAERGAVGMTQGGARGQGAISGRGDARGANLDRDRGGRNT